MLGTEWENQDQVHAYNWNFDHLADMLDDENSVLYAKKFIHLIGSTEAQTIGSSTEVWQIPVITAIVSDNGPLNDIGVTSVQKKEEIVSMASMKLVWKPYYGDGLPRTRAEKARVYVLHCNERASRLKNLKKKSEEDFHRYQYLLGYHLRPEDLLDEQKQCGETKVNLVEKIEGVAKGVHVEFNWKSDKLADVLEEAKDDYELNDEQVESLKKSLQKAVEDEKEKRKAKMEASKVTYDGYTQEERDNLTNLKTYKFYPQNTEPNVASVEDKKVNRYFGVADGVFPPIPQKAAFGSLLLQ